MFAKTEWALGKRVDFGPTMFETSGCVVNSNKPINLPPCFFSSVISISTIFDKYAAQEKEIGQEKTCKDDRGRETFIYGTKTVSRRRNEEEKGRHADAVLEGTYPRSSLFNHCA